MTIEKILNKIREYVDATGMLVAEPGKELHLLVGVSGGADSVALLYLLKYLKIKYEFSLEVIHIEHGIRGQESKEDALFVEKLCAEWGIEFTIRSVDVPAYARESRMGLEEAARELRYQQFAKRRKEISPEKDVRIVLAHHMEDNAETILFQMARGSGLRGLCGMQPMRRTADGACYIRPLLVVKKEELLKCLEEAKIPHREDSTNQDDRYSRNRIRNRVLPELLEINAQTIAHINNSANQLRLIANYLETQIREYEPLILKEKDGNVHIQMKELEKLHPVFYYEFIRRAIDKVAGHTLDLSTVHLDKIKELWTRQTGRKVHFWYGFTAHRSYDEIIIRYHASEEKPEIVNQKVKISSRELQKLKESGKTEQFLLEGKWLVELRVFAKDEKITEIPKKRYTKWFDYDTMGKGFSIRRRQDDDYLIIDAAGHHKKIKKLLVDERIPSEQREKLWFVACQEHILWMIGGRISEAGKVTEQTQWIVELSVQQDQS